MVDILYQVDYTPEKFVKIFQMFPLILYHLPTDIGTQDFSELFIAKRINQSILTVKIVSIQRIQSYFIFH